MKLIPNWRMLHRMWSIRLMALGVVLDGALAALPAFTEAVPPLAFLALNIGLGLAAMVARLIQQPEIHDAEKP